jgi:hypothetical protein
MLKGITNTIARRALLIYFSIFAIVFVGVGLVALAVYFFLIGGIGLLNATVQSVRAAWRATWAGE